MVPHIHIQPSRVLYRSLHRSHASHNFYGGIKKIFGVVLTCVQPKMFWNTGFWPPIWSLLRKKAIFCQNWTSSFFLNQLLVKISEVQESLAGHPLYSIPDFWVLTIRMNWFPKKNRRLRNFLFFSGTPKIALFLPEIIILVILTHFRPKPNRLRRLDWLIMTFLVDTRTFLYSQKWSSKWPIHRFHLRRQKTCHLPILVTPLLSRSSPL